MYVRSLPAVCIFLVWWPEGYIKFVRPAKGMLSSSHFLVSLNVLKCGDLFFMCVSPPLCSKLYLRLFFRNNNSISPCLSALFESLLKYFQKNLMSLCFCFESLLRYFQKVRTWLAMSRCFLFRKFA
jgi:hypothetical protein